MQSSKGLRARKTSLAAAEAPMSVRHITDMIPLRARAELPVHPCPDDPRCANTRMQCSERAEVAHVQSTAEGALHTEAAGTEQIELRGHDRPRSSYEGFGLGCSTK